MKAERILAIADSAAKAKALALAAGGADLDAVLELYRNEHDRVVVGYVQAVLEQLEEHRGVVSAARIWRDKLGKPRPVDAALIDALDISGQKLLEGGN